MNKVCLFTSGDVRVSDEEGAAPELVLAVLGLVRATRQASRLASPTAHATRER